MSSVAAQAVRTHVAHRLYSSIFSLSCTLCGSCRPAVSRLYANAPSASNHDDVDPFTKKLNAKAEAELADLVKKQASSNAGNDDDDMEDIVNHETGEIGGSRQARRGYEPTRYGDWELNGRCTDF